MVGIGALVLSLTVPALAAGPATGKKLYRYTNDKGVVVLGFSIPPDQVYRGYSVLSPNGTVLEVVQPSMSPKEREEYQRRAPERLKEEEARKKQEDADRQLIAVFATAADVDRARDRKLEAIDLQISVSRSNASRLRTELNASEEQAANRERSGQAVPDFMVDKIDSLQRQVSQLEDAIRKRKQEKERVRQEYAKDRERLEYLLSQPELLRSLQPGEKSAQPR
ncbi:conserved hypothetical protein [gamma proteobacterium HdN1]|nr:conserved hypothetical protein [gamma proteobacterium HdN1]